MFRFALEMFRFICVTPVSGERGRSGVSPAERSQTEKRLVWPEVLYSLYTDYNEKITHEDQAMDTTNVLNSST